MIEYFYKNKDNTEYWSSLSPLEESEDVIAMEHDQWYEEAMELDRKINPKLDNDDEGAE